MKSPCDRYCPDRTTICHCHCEKYKQYAQDRKEHNQKIQEAKKLGRMFRELKRDGCEKERRRHERH